MNIGTYNMDYLIQNNSNLEQKLEREANKDELKQVCQEFEAYFLEQMFKSMRNTVPDGGLIEKSHGEEIFEDMLYQEYAKEASKTESLGLAQMLYQQLSRNQI
ncbi:flagellar protein FlgJ [Natranaerovirga hydrolytica]|uniref:Flagellar protein FlgJ n=1 Tax=Natranaerovirga hydrolytica TaxID=680378 RepID=A0A4R1MS22_9FIRM|nr:rod-binding protein [Natranaerovirga hydrolytica]TCK93369.1 flagellar protein FlgJ [Natranaerovirga hydrolytica]